MQKAIAPLALAVGILFLGGVWLRGQGSREAVPGAKKDARTISTTGSATIRVKPDSARLYISLQTIAPTVKAARSENNTKFNRLQKSLEGLKLADLKMKTADVHVEPLYTRAVEDDEIPRVKGYRVTHDFTVLIEDADTEKLTEKAGRILDLALEGGANNVQRISLFKKDEAALRREALAKAVENGVANAKALAAGIKATVSDTISIDTAPEYSWGYGALGGFGGQGAVQNAIPAPAAGGDDTHIVAGLIEITCRVNVTCTY